MLRAGTHTIYDNSSVFILGSNTKQIILNTIRIDQKSDEIDQNNTRKDKTSH